MIEIETIVRARLEHRYPAPTRDPDWTDVLERLASTERVGPRRWLSALAPRLLRQRFVLVGAVALAAAAAGLVLAAPWRGGPSFVQQALAAVGTGRYVHAVLQTSEPYYQFLDLATGKTRLSVNGPEFVYDTKTGAFESRAIFDGVAFPSDEAPDPAVTNFASGYRNALSNGDARIIGETTVNGQQAKIIRFPIRFALPGGKPDKNSFERHSSFEDVAVSEESHAPLWVRTAFRQLDPRHARARDLERRFPIVVSPCPCRRLVSISSSNKRPTLPRPHKISPRDYDVGGEATDLRRLDPADAQVAFRHVAFWVGRTFEGTTLQKVRLQRLAHWPLDGAAKIIPAKGTLPPGGKIGGPGLRLDYRGDKASLEIDQSPSLEPAYGFVPAWASPPLGQASLNCDDCAANRPPGREHWYAQFRKSGLFIRIRSKSRSLVVRAALALAPIPSRG
jgi:hypothetical protein